MNPDTLIKIEKSKRFLEENNILYVEYANGQLQVDGINYWATSEKWFDAGDNVKGKGLNSFIKYLKSKDII